jgi:hypothetical protein
MYEITGPARFRVGGVESLDGRRGPLWVATRWRWEGYEFGETGAASHVGADFHYFAREFVADCEGDLDGGACPGIPIVNMTVGAADDAEEGCGNASE